MANPPPGSNDPDNELKCARKIVEDVLLELSQATERFGPFNSAHEGWAVLFEEVDGLRLEVFKRQKIRSVDRMRREAVQTAAMAIRFIYDVCDAPKTDVAKNEHATAFHPTVDPKCSCSVCANDSFKRTEQQRRWDWGRR